MRRIHPVFHVSLLEQAPKDATPAEDIEIEDETGEYEVEQILDMQRINNQPFYLIKWKGYDTFRKIRVESIDNLTNASYYFRIIISNGSNAKLCQKSGDIWSSN